MAVLLAESVNVLLVVELVGLKVAVTPAGNGGTVVKATVPLNPFVGVVTLIVLVPLVP